VNNKSSLNLSVFNEKGKNTARDVGIVFPCYGYERVSYSLPLANVNFKRVYALPIYRVIKANFYKNTPVLIPSNIDLLHTWNAIPITLKPFIISFENEFPRYFGKLYKWQELLGLSILNSKRCHSILALSEIAAELARDKFRYLGYPGIATKIGVFRGGVTIDKELLGRKRVYYSGGTLKLIFIGGDIFPKGFSPAFKALEQLVKNGVKLEFIVVGRFKKGGYVLKEYSPDPESWKGILNEAFWVTHYEQLSNNEVLDKLSKQDLLISPSYDETLGWSIVEAGLLGVPAITTNVFALPELVKHKLSGYMINLKLGKQNRWQGVWKSGAALELEIEEANNVIYDGVIRAVTNIIQEPELLKKYSENAQLHMRDLYDVEKSANILTSIYKKAMNR